mmetsp:Transcript_67176/g.194251  ORF Transcript_67176/g.194251 Transcript_67176/m.194251 type:complete len:479 (+) Transcript_67176:112-1548(+)
MCSRCRCPEEICGIDIDDIFAYQTRKFVRIRDHRLGVIYYIAVLAVFAYIVVYTLAYKLRYLEFYRTNGNIRLKLWQPVVDHCDVDSNSCEDAFPRTTDLKYCCRDGCEPLPENGEGACSCPTIRGYPSLDCSFYDGDTVGVLQRDGIFVATRMRTQHEVLNKTCTARTATQCSNLWSIASSRTIFVAGIEDFTLLIDHAAQAPEIGFAAEGRFLHGLLRVPGRGPVEQALCAMPGAVDDYYHGQATSSAPCYVEPGHPKNTALDFFTIGTLLAAGGVTLDDESFSGSGCTARYEGITMLIDIHYYNAVPWRGVLGHSSYYYEVTANRNNAYGQHQVMWDPRSPNRVVIAMHGILIQAGLGGSIGAFVFNNLVLQVAASLALLFWVTAAVNFIAQYMMKHRVYYKAALIDRTADFSDVPRLEALSTHELRDMCAGRSLARGGPREEVISRLIADDYDDAFQSETSTLTREAEATPLLL